MNHWLILIASIVAFFVVLLLATRWLQRSLRVPSPLERRLLKSAKPRYTVKGNAQHVAILEARLNRVMERVTALEEFERATTTMVERHERRLNRVAEELTEHLKAATPSTDSLPDTETPAEQGSTKTLSYSELFPASQGGTPKP